MKVIDTAISEIKILEPKTYSDERGFFMESYNQKDFDESLGRPVVFVQDNHSRSSRNVVRGLHYQIGDDRAQGKLVRVVQGRVFDVAVDLRRSSPTFAQWVGVELSGDNHRQLWIERGFAHGFMVLSETADFVYKTTDFFSAEHDRCLAWNDPDVGIEWPLADATPILSDRDARGKSLKDAELFP